MRAKGSSGAPISTASPTRIACNSMSTARRLAQNRPQCALICARFARIGVEIRDSGAAPLVHFGGYTNGWDGYVPNAEDFGSNGYEVEWATPYAPEAAGVLAREAQRLAADLMAAGGRA